MRIVFILIASIIGAGGLVATLKVPNTKNSERLLQQYRAEPAGTLKNLEMAIFECVPETSKSAAGRRLTGQLIAPLYIKISSLRFEGVRKDAFADEIRNWMVTNHPKLLKTLSDKDFLELTGYIKKIGEDDVENCVLSSVRRPVAQNINSKDWELRLN